MHLLLKIGLHPTRSWNKSWLPVLQSWPKSRSPCHLQTWGLNITTALSLPTTLLLCHTGLTSGSSLWPLLSPGLAYYSHIVLFLGFRHQGIGAPRGCQQTEIHSTLSPLPAFQPENEDCWEEGLEFGRHHSPFYCGPCSDAPIPAFWCVFLYVPVHRDTGPVEAKEGYVSLSVAEPGVRLAMNKPHCEQLVSTPPQCCGKGKHRVILGFLCGAEDLNSGLTFAQQMPSPTKPSP